jgi:UDP-3-O-[3-hydroxymyristoyl] glucosamine N-acyltransferase
MKTAEISALLGGQLEGDANAEISGIAGLSSAGPADLSFVEGPAALAQAQESGAGCLLVPMGARVAGKNTIAVSHPKLALIKAVRAILPERRMAPGVHASAVIAPGARVAAGAAVGAHTVIEDGAIIGEATQIGAGVTIGQGVEVGAGCVIHPRVTLYANVKLGDRVIIHAGAVLGADGFGYVFAEGRHHKFPQLGRVIVEDDVEIGANSTIDRGSLGDTVIGAGSKIDNLVQLAHNVRIGRHCVIAAQTGIAGSVHIGDYVMLGGQVGIAERVRIEDQVSIGAQAGVLPDKRVRRGARLWGTPARPMPEYKETYAQVAGLPKLARRVEELEQAMKARGQKKA